MTTTFTARAVINIHAPIAKVWDALTNPVIIKQYMFGTDAVSDWKVGSPIVYKGSWEGKVYEDKGVIKRLEKEKVLETSYWSSFSGLPDAPENYQLVTYEVDETNGVTTLTITQSNAATEEAKAHSEKNWHMVLSTLKALLEK